MKLGLTVLVVAVVAVLSAGAGVGATLLIAKSGPQGARGEQGPPGPEGAEGEEGSIDSDALEVEGWEVDELYEYADEFDSRLNTLESSNSETEFALTQLCQELNTVC